MFDQQQTTTLELRTIFDGTYEIIDLLGSGGMGVVYKARHVELDKLAALKLLRLDALHDGDSIRRFTHEARTASALKHPNIASVQKYGVLEKQPYIAFDFLEGATLDDVLNRDEKLGFKRFLRVFDQVCDGLKFAHECGVIHRDLKPANIFLIDDNGADQVKIVDFGLAKEVGTAGGEAQRLTKTGVVLGTPLYMSPEQGQGADVSFVADIYSLACVMYEACFGLPPFRGESAYEILFQHAYSQPAFDKLPADYPPGLVAVLTKAMQKLPEDRYQSIGELQDALAGLDSEISGPDANGKRRTSGRQQHLPVAARFNFVKAAVISLMIGALLVVSCVAAVRNPNYIVFEWNRNHNAALLRERLGALSNEGAITVLHDLEIPLFHDLSVQSAAAFLDIEEHLDPADSDRRDLLRNAQVILHLMPEKNWANPEAAHQYYRLVQLATRKRAGMDAAFATLKTLQNFAFDQNYPAMAAVWNEVKGEFAIRPKITREIDRQQILAYSRNLRFASPTTARELIDLVDQRAMLGTHTANLREKAKFFDAVGDSHSALSFWKEQFEWFKDYDAHPTEKISALVGCADDLVLLHNTREALEKYNAALEILRSLPDRDFKDQSLLHISDAFFWLNDKTRADELCQQVVADSQEWEKMMLAAHNQLGCGLAELNGAEAYLRLGQPTVARDLFARSHSNLIDPPILIARRVSSLMMPITVQTENDTAIAALPEGQRQIALSTENTAREKARLAGWFDYRGELKAAAENQQQAAKIRDTIVRGASFQDWMSAGSLWDRVRDYGAAAQCYDNASRAASSEGDQKAALAALAHQRIAGKLKVQTNGPLEAMLGSCILTMRDTGNSQWLATTIDLADVLLEKADTGPEKDRAQLYVQAQSRLKDALLWARGHNIPTATNLTARQLSRTLMISLTRMPPANFNSYLEEYIKNTFPAAGAQVNSENPARGHLFPSSR